MTKDSRIYIAGHTGLIGTVLYDRLKEKGYTSLLTRPRSELDLTDQQQVERFFKENHPEYVIMNAAMPANSINVRANPVGLMLSNMAMVHNVFDAAVKNHVKKLLYVCSVACYPSDAKVEALPDGDKTIHEIEMKPGKIEKETERYYALPKLMGAELCRAINRNGLMKCVSVIVPHAYGIHYYYDDPQRLPVYPALVKRFCDAAETGAKDLIIWGTGKLRREFTHVYDLADAYILLIEEDEVEGFYNVGSGRMVPICELAERLAAITGYKGKVIFDTTKPDAQEFPVLCSDRLKALGWQPSIDLDDGIRLSVEYYRKHNIKQ